MPDVLQRLKSALADRYAVESAIGRGGMAVVFLARDLRHERRVAIKVLHPELTATLGAERFLNEIKTVAGLQHPHILPLYESGEADGLLYYVMPYAEGESLRQRLDRHGQMGVNESVRIAMEVADGLDYAHRKGVIHRDIKPGNILLAEGHATIADFGIARAIEAAREERVTTTGLGVGTPLYASPEQAAGEETVDGRADIYSLGCVLYEMLAGEPPLTGATPKMIQARRMSETPTSLHAIRDTVPPAVDHAIGRALARVPADRFETAGEFGKALQEVLLATTPGERVPTADWEVPTRPKSRLRWVGLAVVLGTAALLTGVLLLSERWSDAEPLRIAVSNATPVTTEQGVEYQPAISPDGSEVAYVEGDIRSSRVVVRSTIAEGGGGGLRPAESLAARQQFPSWTPDGASIRFAAALQGTWEWKQVGKLGGFVETISMPRVSSKYEWSWDGTHAVFAMNDSIFAVPADDGELQLLGVHLDEQGMHSFAWSPDGQRLAYVLGNPGWRFVPNTASASIWVLDIGSGTPIQITDGGLSVSPQWLPDGRHLLFISDTDGVRGIDVVEVGPEGPLGPPRSVLPSSDPHSISISRDGRKLAYSNYTARHNVWSIPIPPSGDASLSDAVPVTTGNQIVEMHSLSRDGTWIAFGSRRRGQNDIYKQRLEGGEQQLVGDIEDNVFMPHWSPDGSEIAFYSNAGDLYVVPADGGTPTVIDMPGFQYGPRWSPDGLAIAYDADWPQGDDRLELRLITRDSVGGQWSDPIPLTDYVCGSPDWAPDGQSVVCGEGEGWIRLSTNGDTLSRYDAATSGLSRTGMPRFSPDGSRVYFIAFLENGPRGAWWTPSSGGEATRVATFGHPSMIVYNHLSVGPDHLYVTVGEWESDIRVVDLEW